MIDQGNPYATAFFNALLWAVTGLVLCIPISQILRGWAEGTIDPLFGIAIVIAIFTLVAFTWATAGTFWMLIFIALLLGVCIGGPIWWEVTNRKENADFRDGKIEKCREAIERDPNNSSAHAFLGDALMEKKSYVAALAQYEEAARLAPLDRRWQTKLRNAREAIEEYEKKHPRKTPLH